MEILDIKINQFKKIKRELCHLILECKAIGMTILLTTHYLEEKLSDRVCILNNSCIEKLENCFDVEINYEFFKIEQLNVLKEIKNN